MQAPQQLRGAELKASPMDDSHQLRHQAVVWVCVMGGWWK